MPSTSKPQARLMAACAHGAGYESCPPPKVAKEFNQADKGTGILSANTGGSIMPNYYAKGGMIESASYAKGGPVLGRTRDFMKEPDQFRAAYHIDPNAGKDKPYGKPGVPGAGKGEDPPPKEKGKSLKAIVPRS